MKPNLLQKSLILAIGTGVAQLLPILSLPVLASYYSPESFNYLALFISVSAILSILSTGRFELAILKPKSERVAFSLFALSSLVSLCFSLFIFILIFILEWIGINNFLQNRFTTTSLLLLPLGVLNYGLIQVLSYWFSRKDKFRLTSYVKIIQSIIVVFFSIMFGLLDFRLNGLVIAFAAGGVFVVITTVYILYRRRKLISIFQLKVVAKSYNEFPKFLMISGLLDTFAIQAPVIFLSAHFTPFEVGSYSFASRIVTAPVSLIGGSISQAFFQAFSKLVQEGKKLYHYFIKTVLILGAFAFVILGFVWIFAPYLFNVFFDPRWSMSGQLASFLAIALIPRFIIAPVSAAMIAMEHIKLLSLWHFLYTLTTALYFSVFSNFSLLTVISYYFIHEIILYTIYFAFIKFSITNPRKL